MRQLQCWSYHKALVSLQTVGYIKSCSTAHLCSSKGRNLEKNAGWFWEESLIVKGSLIGCHHGRCLCFRELYFDSLIWIVFLISFLFFSPSNKNYGKSLAILFKKKQTRVHRALSWKYVLNLNGHRNQVSKDLPNHKIFRTIVGVGAIAKRKTLHQM